MTRHQILSIALGLVTVGASACNHGTRPQDFRPAVSPVGATVWVLGEGDRREREGELFAVDSSGVLVLSGRLVRFRWERLARLDVVGLGGDFDVRPRAKPDSALRARLALVSRFPQGLDGDLLRRVLATLGQEAVDEAGGARRDGRDLDALAEAAARASTKYGERSVAIAAGYRRIGSDFPAMGEHWLRADALLHAEVDPERPTMLTYVTVASRPVLVGTGYVMTTRGDETPSDVAGWPAEWHEHSGLIAEESGARAPGATHAHRGAATDRDRTRVWVLHIWTGATNPAGRYRADN